MNHWKARRLLPGILDDTVPTPLEAEVHAHVERCRRCRQVLRELVAAEQLLARLPLTLVPLHPARAAESRLARLALWVPDTEPSWQERVGLSALGAFAAAAVLVLTLSSAGLLPRAEEPHADPVTLAAVLPEARLFPTGVR